MARTVNVLVPAVVGVPEIAPPVARLRPAGSVPLAIDQLYGGVPPDAASDCEYAVPTVPLGSDAVVTASVGGLITSVRDAVAVCDEAATRTLNVALPAVVGVPERTPALERLSPAGRVPLASDQPYGGVPPDAPRACE